MHRTHYIIEKNQGETPLQSLTRLREMEKIPLEIPLAYAGRLDPMASGKLLVLVGDECKKQAGYHALDKAYDFEILFGFSTDTGDILGIPSIFPDEPIPEATIRELVSKLPGHLSLPYPIFSSKTVGGKPLFLWQLEGRISEIQIPVAETTLYAIRYVGSSEVRGSDLLLQIETRINTLPAVEEESKKLGANFRRDDILKEWRALLSSHQDTVYQIAQFTATVSSGTYIRALAPHIASLLGAHGLAFSIHRTTLGRYKALTKTRGFWWKKYQ